MKKMIALFVFAMLFLTAGTASAQCSASCSGVAAKGKGPVRNFLHRVTHPFENRVVTTTSTSSKSVTVTSGPKTMPKSDCPDGKCPLPAKKKN